MPPDPITYRRAARMRRALTPPEARLWLQMKGKRLEGFRFRRQHPFGPYILDFYCPAARLAVEIDGLAHTTGDRPARDERRDAWLAEQGVSVLRFEAVTVRDDLEAVVLGVLAALREA